LGTRYWTHRWHWKKLRFTKTFQILLTPSSKQLRLNVVVDFVGDLDEGVNRIRETIEGLDIGVLINNVGISYPYARFFGILMKIDDDENDEHNKDGDEDYEDNEEDDEHITFLLKEYLIKKNSNDMYNNFVY
jgi:hypothetical protein